jgi:ribosomal protein L22
MADETEIEPGEGADGEAARPARRSRRAAAKPPAEETQAKPRRSRAAKAEATEAAAEEEPKPRARRARSAKPAEEAVATEEVAATEGAPKPRRTRARAAAASTEEAAAGEEAAAEEEGAGEAPKPRRRSRAAADAQDGAAEPAAPRRVRAPRPTLRRGRELPALENVVVYASARYVRSSARKARLVCDHIRGKSVPEARAILAFAPRGVARDWAKLLDSAVANAEHNFELIGDELRVKEAYADEGPTLKRFRPRAMGRATPIHKKTSHLTITLTPEA